MKAHTHVVAQQTGSVIDPAIAQIKQLIPTMTEANMIPNTRAIAIITIHIKAEKAVSPR